MKTKITEQKINYNEMFKQFLEKTQQIITYTDKQQFERVCKKIIKATPKA